jgi:hypothetical protein
LSQTRLIGVGNLRNTTEGIRCDRLSALGNPFVLLTRDDMTARVGSVNAYGLYLHYVVNEALEPIEAIERIKLKQRPGQQLLIVSSTPKPSRNLFINEMARLEEMYWTKQPITLLCWCHPLPCHCDRIVDYLKWKCPL